MYANANPTRFTDPMGLAVNGCQGGGSPEEQVRCYQNALAGGAGNITNRFPTPEELKEREWQAEVQAAKGAIGLAWDYLTVASVVLAPEALFAEGGAVGAFRGVPSAPLLGVGSAVRLALWIFCHGSARGVRCSRWAPRSTGVP